MGGGIFNARLVYQGCHASVGISRRFSRIPVVSRPPRPIRALSHDHQASTIRILTIYRAGDPGFLFGTGVVQSANSCGVPELYAVSPRAATTPFLLANPISNRCAVSSSLVSSQRAMSPAATNRVANGGGSDPCALDRNVAIWSRVTGWFGQNLSPTGGLHPTVIPAAASALMSAANTEVLSSTNQSTLEAAISNERTRNAAI